MKTLVFMSTDLMLNLSLVPLSLYILVTTIAAMEATLTLTQNVKFLDFVLTLNAQNVVNEEQSG